MIQVKENSIQDKNLKKYICGIWLLEAKLPEGYVLTSRDVPNGEMQLILNLGDLITGEKFDGRSETIQRHFLRGQHTRFNLVHKTGHLKMLGITFLPLGMAPFTKEPVSDFTDQLIHADEVFPGITELINNNQSFEELQKIVEDYFIGQFDENRHLINKIEDAISKINTSKGLVTISELSSDLEISAKHLERTFKSMVGLTPKQYARQIRIKNVVEDIHKGKDDLMDLVVEYNFYDLAHLTKEFKIFTGITPGKFDRHVVTFNHSYSDEREAE